MQLENKLIEIRAITRFLVNLGHHAKDIFSLIKRAYGDNIITGRTIDNYCKAIQSGEFSIYDHQISGRPKNQLDIETVRNYFEIHTSASTRECEDFTGIHHSTISSILREELNMEKVNFKWIPYNLSDSNKQKRVVIAHELLNLFSTLHPQELNNVLTQDETWIYFQNPHDAMWLDVSQPVPRRPKPSRYRKKSMISVIWSRSGIKSITLLPQNKHLQQVSFQMLF